MLQADAFVCFLYSHSILWLLLVIAVTALFSFILASRIQKFFNYEINVNVDIVYRKEILFPAVTICNHNFLRWVCQLLCMFLCSHVLFTCYSQFLFS